MRHLQLYRTYPILCHFDSPTASGSSNSRRTSFRQFYSAAAERSFLARKGGHSRAKRPSKGFTRTQVVTISSELLFFPSQFVFFRVLHLKLEKLGAGHIRLLQVPDESPKEADRELSKVFGWKSIHISRSFVGGKKRVCPCVHVLVDVQGLKFWPWCFSLWGSDEVHCVMRVFGCLAIAAGWCCGWVASTQYVEACGLNVVHHANSWAYTIDL